MENTVQISLGADLNIDHIELMGDNTMTEETKFDLNEELKALGFTTEDGSGYITYEDASRSTRGFFFSFEEEKNSRDKVRVRVQSIGNKEAVLTNEDYDRLADGMHIARDMIRYARHKSAADEVKFMLDVFHDINVK